MEILVFSAARKPRGYFRPLPRKARFLHPRELKKTLAQTRYAVAEPQLLVYLDLYGLSEAEARKHLRQLAAQDRLAYGVIDPAGRVRDAAELLRQGAVDYLGKTLLKEGLGRKRLNRIDLYLRHRFRQEPAAPGRKDAVAASAKTGAPAAAADWQGIVAGREYTFCFMFIELDGREEMEKKYERSNLGMALASFRKHIESSVGSYGGRVWIWSGFGGIVLFPYDGGECAALRCGFRFVLFKHLYDIEESLFPNLLSFRIIFHLGETVYVENGTGHIISDTLNSIFHLGQQFAKAGNFYITEEVLRRAHPAFRDSFLDVGVFEGRKIYRLRLPVHTGREG